jgi:glutamate racemase
MPVAPKPSLPIGVFDSGVGGLTVVKELFRQMPAERVVYFGDTARYPYGNKAPETLRRFALENARFLSRQRIKLLVVACNSSSAYCLPLLRRSLGLPVVGVIEPGARAAFRRTHLHRVGVIGTAATISSGAYQGSLKKLDASLRVFANPCPLFVPLVEEGWLDHPVTGQVVREYLQPFKARRVDTLVLGCTHYPLLKGVISRVLGPQVSLVDSAEETASEVKQLLSGQGLLARGPAQPISAHRFFVSDVPEKFVAVGKRFLGKMPKVVQAQI